MKYKRICRVLSSSFAAFKYLMICTIGCFIPLICYAEDAFLQTDPWDRSLRAVLQIMTGPTATTIGAIALASTGYLFLRGRIDIMRLMAIIAGLALIFGAPHLASLLQQHAS
ncbi:MAG: TrbC/VIRB2 pilin [Gammaproteobacteria bacterium]|nr:TrbC/VIRB2 pilin [Gammaproteobacteria bacterium]